MCKTTSPAGIFLTAQGKIQNPLLLKPQKCMLPVVKKEVPEEKKTNETKFSTGRWTQKEHEKFLEGLKELGKNWREISGIMKTRSPVQVRTHAQKFFLKMARNEMEQSGNDQEIGLEFTSLKKDTAVLSSCLSNVESQPQKYQYEVRRVPTIPPPIQPKPIQQQIPVQPHPVDPPLVPTLSVVKSEAEADDLTFDASMFDAPCSTDDSMERVSTSSSGEFSEFDSGFDSSDLDSTAYDSGLEDVFLNEVEPGCLYHTLPAPKSQELLQRLLEEELDTYDIASGGQYEVSYPQLGILEKRRRDNVEGWFESLTKKPRVFYDD